MRSRFTHGYLNNHRVKKVNIVSTEPAFETERFDIVPLNPTEARQLVEVLLQDELLADRIPWLLEKTRDGALREAFGLQLMAAAGQVRVWGIVARNLQLHIGAVIARNSLEGINVEVLVASQFWDQGVVDEASEHVLDWLEDQSDWIEDFALALH